jgi:predicted HicB family RNase H-like nuclease
MKQLGRPTEFSSDRVTKALRVSPELDRRLKIAAAERGVSVNVLINAALTDYLQRLVPVEELFKAQ